MNHFNKIRNLYKVTAGVILITAVIITIFFLWQGFKAQKENSATVISETKKADDAKTISQNEIQKSQNTILVIDKINLSAPVLLNINGNNTDEYNGALEKGLAHLKGSATPGKEGNMFIFGHSSYDAKKAGQYKEVFSKLNELVNGDLIEIQNLETRYTYKVSDKKVVAPNDVSVAGQNFSLKQITLMTCWPIGSTEKRLVVVGEMVE